MPKEDGRSILAQKKRQQRRQQILIAAEKVIGERGFHAASIADVLKQARISRGTFYLYFDSREALFEEILEQFIKKLKAAIKPVRIEKPKPVQQLYENVLAVVQLLFNHQNLSAILLKEAVGHHHLGFVQARMDTFYAFVHRKVSSALKNGVKLGLLREVDDKLLAVAIVGSIKEVVFHYLVVKREPAPAPERIAQELLEFGISGLSATPEESQCERYEQKIN